MKAVPSQLRAVQAFGAVARAGSVVGAARELAVSPSALAAISDALSGFSRRGTELRISTISTFAVRWLIPRLSRFQSLHPDIEIFLSTSTRAVDLSQETF